MLHLSTTYTTSAGLHIWTNPGLSPGAQGLGGRKQNSSIIPIVTIPVFCQIPKKNIPKPSLWTLIFIQIWGAHPEN